MAVAPIVTKLASSGVILVSKSKSFTKFEPPLSGLNPNISNEGGSWNLFLNPSIFSIPGMGFCSMITSVLSFFTATSKLLIPPKALLIPSHIDCTNL